MKSEVQTSYMFLNVACSAVRIASYNIQQKNNSAKQFIDIEYYNQNEIRSTNFLHQKHETSYIWCIMVEQKQTGRECNFAVLTQAKRPDLLDPQSI